MKKQEMWKKWWFWVVVVLIFSLLSFIGTDETDNKKENTNSNNNQNNAEIVNPEEKENEYAEDNIVNEFIKQFKTTSNYELTDIEKGNIRTKYFAHINGQSCELLNATGTTANYFQITIYGGNNDGDIDKIIKVYEEVIKTLDPTISKTQIDSTMSEHRKNPATSYNISDSITVKLYPIVELSWGKSDCRIEITTTLYN